MTLEFEIILIEARTSITIVSKCFGFSRATVSRTIKEFLR